MEFRRKGITCTSWLLMKTDLQRNTKYNELALMVPRQIMVLIERGLTYTHKHAKL